MNSIISKFYTAFNKLDAETMTSLYHDDITFSDPAFGKLTGNEAKAMWQMLCESQKGKDFKVGFFNVEENETHGSANWDAYYNFSKTGRKVHNKISAKFKFKDGLIIEHHDDFDLHSWSKQALGFKGLLLGGTNFFKKKLQEQTKQLLLNYIKKQAR